MLCVVDRPRQLRLQLERPSRKLRLLRLLPLLLVTALRVKEKPASGQVLCLLWLPYLCDVCWLAARQLRGERHLDQAGHE
jgi:hypothetical protein